MLRTGLFESKPFNESFAICSSKAGCRFVRDKGSDNAPRIDMEHTILLIDGLSRLELRWMGIPPRATLRFPPEGEVGRRIYEVTDPRQHLSRTIKHRCC